ncbi:hypothetical protein N7481_003851 [Penicillium waksmanii]|uniref:uncharacterized protein n=1 Tax=Penicillium waksmanii TaxID=69791 RepID=UPI0025468D7B|nr:uncharacterized protein N7481_003851 [Penicillium waksmanii]KAJ5988641.1 hypothetical protein N7481_003851 [Penicillium waksmanii]
MAANATTDIDEIAKRIASITIGSSSVGTGSYWNPEGRTDNRVFNSLAVLLNMPTPELSRRTGVAQPRNGSGGMSRHEISKLLRRTRELGFVATFRISNVPFDYKGLSSGEMFKRCNQMVLYLHPPGPDGHRYGHYVVGASGIPIRDFQSSAGRERRVIDEEVYPNGRQGRGSSIVSTIVVLEPGPPGWSP